MKKLDSEEAPHGMDTDLYYCDRTWRCEEYRMSEKLQSQQKRGTESAECRNVARWPKSREMQSVTSNLHSVRTTPRVELWTKLKRFESNSLLCYLWRRQGSSS